MKKENLAKYLPLIVGIFLGLVSVSIGKISPAIASWSGMKFLGNNLGYLLGAFLVAYFNSQKWITSFMTSSLTIIIATVVYYFLIFLMRIFHIGFIEDVAHILNGLLFWSLIGVVCGALSATAVRLIRYSKTNIVRIGALTATYSAMLWVIYDVNIIPMMNLYQNPDVSQKYIDGFFAGRNFAADLFEVIVSILLLTMLYTVLLRKVKKVKEIAHNEKISRGETY